jgi:hypothetical protein
MGGKGRSSRGSGFHGSWCAGSGRLRGRIPSQQSWSVRTQWRRCCSGAGRRGCCGCGSTRRCRDWRHCTDGRRHGPGWQGLPAPLPPQRERRLPSQLRQRERADKTRGEYLISVYHLSETCGRHRRRRPRSLPRHGELVAFLSADHVIDILGGRVDVDPHPFDFAAEIVAAGAVVLRHGFASIAAHIHGLVH